MISLLLSRFLAPALGLALAAALALAGWHWHQASAARADAAEVRQQFGDYRETQERQARQALEQQRADKNRSDKLRQEALDAEHLARLAHQADADRLRGTAGQLQRYAADLAASLGAAHRDPATASSSAAAATAADLLAQLPGRLDQAAEELALYAADAARAGQLCQRSYDALSPITTTSPGVHP